MKQLRGARVLVTGANGGIGRSISRAFVDAGCSVVVSGRRREELERLADDIGAVPILADLARRSDLDELISGAGEVDVLVANAALPASGDLEGWDQTEIDRALEVNLASPIATTRALLPGMRARGKGHFVFVSSMSGKVASKGTSIYSATKFGLRGFAAGLRADLHGSRVGCSVVLPGFVRDAGMFADTGVRLPRYMGTSSPEQVAGAVLKAVRTNRAEVAVAPLGVRLGATIGSLSPGVSTRMQARLGGSVADEMSAAQRSKR